jgi:hypothetical protein
MEYSGGYIFGTTSTVWDIQGRTWTGFLVRAVDRHKGSCHNRFRVNARWNALMRWPFDLTGVWVSMHFAGCDQLLLQKIHYNCCSSLAPELVADMVLALIKPGSHADHLTEERTFWASWIHFPLFRWCGQLQNLKLICLIGTGGNIRKCIYNIFSEEMNSSNCSAWCRDLLLHGAGMLWFPSDSLSRELNRAAT